MEAWRKKLDKFLDGDLKLFEEDYKITYPCVLKRGRKRIKGRIDMDHGIVYNLNGKEIRRVKAV
ncbi:hypothetical protein HYH70_17880 [Clostridium botulinum]|uniref:hypothetical protein n=1 Tax=Clostridium botulinum TaxID=1491 RepID=UPI00035BA1B1|nr:hypothetical protein [Clostridium botulinum]EPS49012.1 hypothetical protein CFSAN002367_18023 [Clostridium botulinum CFSAN002367]KON09704.1 hypothetical protein ACP52_08490 [Clostridium botulinum]MBY6907438.1 hypothetical protein [Clostridium botulinum]MBY6927750.1 hypothetical protein [Clostridium botulinum]MBY6955088.1 hypothetical protein [Clostridium botulinum]